MGILACLDHSNSEFVPEVEGAWQCPCSTWHQQREHASSNFSSHTWRLQELHQQGGESLRLITWLGSEPLQCNEPWKNNTPESSHVSKAVGCQGQAGGELLPQPGAVHWGHPCRSTASAEELWVGKPDMKDGLSSTVAKEKKKSVFKSMQNCRGCCSKMWRTWLEKTMTENLWLRVRRKEQRLMISGGSVTGSGIWLGLALGGRAS